jgi:CHASE1-domain containing sensor protein
MKETSPGTQSLDERLPFISVIGWVVLICGLVLTIGLGYIASNSAKLEALGRFQFRSHEVQVAIEERLKAYEQVLRGGVGLIESAHHNVDRDMFKTYVEHLNIDERYRSIQGIGLSIPVSLQDKEKHIQEVRESGIPSFPNYQRKGNEDTNPGNLIFQTNLSIQE